jgi:hypothetical protein
VAGSWENFVNWIVAHNKINYGKFFFRAIYFALTGANTRKINIYLHKISEGLKSSAYLDNAHAQCIDIGCI